MTRERKTRDEFQIHSNHGYGWDEVCSEDTRKEARAQLRCYRENEPNASHKLVHKRVPLVKLFAGQCANCGERTRVDDAGVCTPCCEKRARVEGGGA